MNKLLTTMNEQKAKFTKACDKASVIAVKRIMSQDQGSAIDVGGQILDKICQFICKSPSATFQKEGADIFANNETLMKAVKNCDPSCNEKAWIRDIADSVNMDVEGNKGRLLLAVSNSQTVNEMMPFFPYFKVLYKFC